MYGMLCVLFGVAVWLILATIYGLPVSTTHSCIGGIIGMAVVAKGWSAVNWKQVGIVASSWIIAPVVSSLLSTCIFVIVRKVILRAPNSVNRALNAYSPIVGFTIAFNLFLVLYKSDSLQINLPIYYIILICIGIGAVVALVLQFTAMPFIRRYVMSVSTEPAIHNDAVEVKVDNGWKTTTEKAGDLTVMTSAPTNVIPLLDMSEEKALEEKLLDEDSTVAQMHSHAEEFDPRTEKLFTYLQIITAVFNSFAHGANDVANSIGPLAACITIYETGDVMQDAKVPAWRRGNRRRTDLSRVQDHGVAGSEHGEGDSVARIYDRDRVCDHRTVRIRHWIASLHHALQGGIDGGRGTGGGQERSQLEASVQRLRRMDFHDPHLCGCDGRSLLCIDVVYPVLWCLLMMKGDVSELIMNSLTVILSVHSS